MMHCCVSGNSDQDTGQNLYELDFLFFVSQEGNTMEGCVPANRLDRFRELLKEGEKEIHDNNPPAENRSYSAHEDSGSLEIFLCCCTMGSPLMF